MVKLKIVYSVCCGMDVHRNFLIAVKHPIAQIQETVDGIFTHEQAEKLKIIRSHMESLEKQKAELESLILEIAQNYLLQIELLLTVPGIHDAFTAIRILAEIGADMSVFQTSKHLCSWAGLTPQNAESTGKKKTTRIGPTVYFDMPFLGCCIIELFQTSILHDFSCPEYVLFEQKL